MGDIRDRIGKSLLIVCKKLLLVIKRCGRFVDIVLKDRKFSLLLVGDIWNLRSRKNLYKIRIKLCDVRISLFRKEIIHRDDRSSEDQCDQKCDPSKENTGTNRRSNRKAGCCDHHAFKFPVLKH